MAVCGVTDWQGDASPGLSGWSISDFYLFFHLLNPLPTRQLWFTCESPRSLVEKYTEYAHGDPLKERRVVLENGLLPTVENPDRVRVVPRGDLHERFLATLSEQSRLAAEEEEPLLVLIFGHGDVHKFGVQIGGVGDPGSGPRLLIDQVNRAIAPRAQVTLLMTSCYSGGWLVRPNLTNNRPLLNTTGMAADADPHSESLSWPTSSSQGRASDSRVASAILQTLVDASDLAVSEELCEHPTYIQLTAQIWDTLKQIDPLAEKSNMRFSAQGNNWEIEYRRRSGLHLLSYQSRWESLRLLPVGGVGDGISVGTTNTNVENSLSYMHSRRGGLKKRVLRHLGRVYLDSFPGLDEAGPNGSLHRVLRKFLSTDKLDSWQIDKRSDQLLYRLDVMREADKMRRHMNLKFPSIFETDVEKWRTEHSGNYELHDMEGRLLNMIRSKGLFDSPIGAARPGYSKPYRYLAIVLIESGIQVDEIEKLFDSAVSCKLLLRLLWIFHLQSGTDKKRTIAKIFHSYKESIAERSDVRVAQAAVFETLRKFRKEDAIPIARKEERKGGRIRLTCFLQKLSFGLNGVCVKLGIA